MNVEKLQPRLRQTWFVFCINQKIKWEIMLVYCQRVVYCLFFLSSPSKKTCLITVASSSATITRTSVQETCGNDSWQNEVAHLSPFSRLRETAFQSGLLLETPFSPLHIHSLLFLIVKYPSSTCPWKQNSLSNNTPSPSWFGRGLLSAIVTSLQGVLLMWEPKADRRLGTFCHISISTLCQTSWA